MLDLRGVFCSSQQENTDNEAMLDSTIRGTGGSLKRLLIDNGCTGNDVAEAIASRGACLEELSMPCCTGLSDSGLTRIALACKQLLRLCVGGPSRYITHHPMMRLRYSTAYCSPVISSSRDKWAGGQRKASLLWCCKRPSAVNGFQP